MYMSYVLAICAIRLKTCQCQLSPKCEDKATAAGFSWGTISHHQNQRESLDDGCNFHETSHHRAEIQLRSQILRIHRWHPRLPGLPRHHSWHARLHHARLTVATRLVASIAGHLAIATIGHLILTLRRRLGIWVPQIGQISCSKSNWGNGGGRVITVTAPKLM